MDYRQSHQTVLIGILPYFAAGALIGVTAWSPYELATLTILFIPAILFYARSKTSIYSLMLGYYVFGLYGLLPGVIQFPTGNWLLGLGVWLISSVILSLPYLLMPKLRWAGWAVISLILFIPPLGLINWLSPLMISGHLFPGLGFAGFVFTVLVLTLIQYRPKTLIIALPLALITPWLLPTEPQSKYTGIDTQFPQKQSIEVDLERDRLAQDMVLDYIAQHDPGIYVFPESSVEYWTSFAAKRLVSRLNGSGYTVLLGVQYPDVDDADEKWVNAISLIDGEQHRIIYKQKMPIPYFMWRPGKGGFKRNQHDSLIDLQGDRVKILICYEAVTPLTFFTDLYNPLQRPDVIIAVGSYSWANGTTIEPIFRKKLDLWGKLFSTPVVISTNN